MKIELMNIAQMLNSLYLLFIYLFFHKSNITKNIKYLNQKINTQSEKRK